MTADGNTNIFENIWYFLTINATEPLAQSMFWLQRMFNVEMLNGFYQET